jgi:hypothetical protein
MISKYAARIAMLREARLEELRTTRAAAAHRPGDVWKTDSGKFRGMNSDGQAKTFADKAKATSYAKGKGPAPAKDEGGQAKGKGKGSVPTTVEMPREGYKAVANALEGWNKPGSWEHVISYAISGRPMQGEDVKAVIDDISDDLGNWNTVAKANGWSNADKKNLTRAQGILKNWMSQAAKKEKANAPAEKPEAKTEKAPAEKPKAPAKGKGKATPAAKPTSYKKTYNTTVSSVMDKHDLTDADADAVRKFKKGKPFSGEKISDAEKMRRFLAKAKPETRERMKGVSVADFIAMLGAILDDEDGGGKQARTRKASMSMLPGDDYNFSW